MEHECDDVSSFGEHDCGGSKDSNPSLFSRSGEILPRDGERIEWHGDDFLRIEETRITFDPDKPLRKEDIIDQQSTLIDTVFLTLTSRMRNFVWDQLGFAGEWTLLPSFVKKRTLETATNMMFDFVERDSRLQWWYWIPDDWWDTSTCKVAANIFSSTELVREIRRLRRWLGTTFCLGGFSALKICWDGLYSPRSSVFRSILGENFLNSIARSHVLFRNLEVKWSMIDSLSRTISLFLGCLSPFLHGLSLVLNTVALWEAGTNIFPGKEELCPNPPRASGTSILLTLKAFLMS
jgi:hypothetical protein